MGERDDIYRQAQSRVAECNIVREGKIRYVARLAGVENVEQYKGFSFMTAAMGIGRNLGRLLIRVFTVHGDGIDP